MGSGEPVVLLHGIMMSERAWQDVAPLLANEYEVIAPTAYGHCGGEAMSARPGTYRDVLAGAARQLDQLGLERAHLVGNSMGGWMALDLARDGRALSVLAISPAGMWPALKPGARRPAAAKLAHALKMGRRARPMLPLVYRSPRAREYAFRNIIAHGARLSPQLALGLTDDMLGCEIAEDMLGGDAYFAPLDPAPCAITIAQAERDRIFPERIYGPLARERVPAARYVVLPGVGHVPMLDDAQLVAATIRESLGEARGDPLLARVSSRAGEPERAHT